MGVLIAGAPLGSLAWAQKHQEDGNILVDAFSFEDKGGWLVDPQFIEQMGSPYLLAHGMGVPVKDATTSIEVPQSGAYYLWVRTKNWCPGLWAPPGIFNISINGIVNETEFGTRDGWNWEEGSIMELEEGPATLALQDLTGFEGRCDAIFLTQDARFRPPNDLAALDAWRKAIDVLEDEPEEILSFDLVITGGGIAGCAAALAAAKYNLKIALVHNRPVLGGNASSEVRVRTTGDYGKGSQILKQIETGNWANSSSHSLGDDNKRQAAMDARPTVTQFLEYAVYDVEMHATDPKDPKAPKKIKSLAARDINTVKKVRLEAPIFLDASGDAFVGFKAGADFRYGREAKDEFGENWDKYGHMWSPDRPDDLVMGTTLMWRIKKAKRPVSFPSVPWAMDVAKNYNEKKIDSQWEYSDNRRHQIDDAEAIRDHMFRAIYGNFYNVKTDPANALLEFEWVGHISGKRESRRLMGDHIYTLKDAINSVYFPDAVVEEKGGVDVHCQRSLEGFELDFISRTMLLKPRKNGLYYVPFRSLYSRNVSNLMMAGRNFSCSHIGLGGLRVQKTTGQMGIACGYAAALCTKYKCAPREIYKSHIRELRVMVGYRGA